ncbi:MAG: DUF1549 and DUF1553 domain-containing protein [Planctomycetes bacterium]|nr:DUF1549 and DUF1553 domain-containing protein [Planctomycetota bacterium]
MRGRLLERWCCSGKRGDRVLSVCGQGIAPHPALVGTLTAVFAMILLATVSGVTQASEASTEKSDSASNRRSDDFGIAEVRLINDSIRQGWSDRELAPAQPATDGEWCRRVYLDVLGRIPTVDELNAFLTDRQRDRRMRLADRLLGEEYRDDYSRNWTTLWTNLLIGRTGGTARESLASRPGLQQYLREALDYNKPYDKLALELITATGSCRPGDDDFNGAANFLADKLAEGGIQATAKTAQIFLGMAVQCTQCHNHPFNEHKQNQFWELNAFFRQTRVETLPDGERQQVARLVDRDFSGEGGDPKQAEIYYELRNGKLKVAYPVFVDGTSLSALYADRGDTFGDRGTLADINRRQELAKLILASREFDLAFVNRLWAHFLGHGFTKPIDDIGPHNPPSHPDLLDQLGMAFRQAGFDLKQLIRWMVLSEPYHLSSRITRGNEKDDPALGARPMFSRFYLRQMEAEPLYESLLVATAAENTLKREQREQRKQQWLDQFNTAFGTDENDEATTFNGSIPQALTLMNGDLIGRATGNERGSMLERVAGDREMANSEKIRYLYLSAFSRLPTRQELAISNELLTARGGDVGAAMQDIWWALLNSNEFILIH